MNIFKSIVASLSLYPAYLLLKGAITFLTVGIEAENVPTILLALSVLLVLTGYSFFIVETIKNWIKNIKIKI